MKILIVATTDPSNASGYKEKLKDFKYEEVVDKNGYVEKTYIEINSLEDLEKLCNAVDSELVVDFRKDTMVYGKPFIEIYDTWRE